MWIFLGCCVIAWTIWFIGRRVVRCLFAIAVLLEMYGANSFTEWEPQTAFDRAFKDFTGEYLK